MTPEEKERLLQVCKQILVEHDHQKLTELIAEMNALLEKKEQSLAEKISPPN